MSADPYRGHRFPEEIISQCVWLYFNFCLSLRDVELMMAFRGVQLSYETIRRWCDKFGKSYAAKLKGKRAKLGDKWHLIGIGAAVARRPLPHHRAYGSVHGGSSRLR